MPRTVTLKLCSTYTFKYRDSQNKKNSVHSFHFTKKAKSQDIWVGTPKNKECCNLLQSTRKAVEIAVRVAVTKTV